MRIPMPGDEFIEVDLLKAGYYAFVAGGAASAASWVPAERWAQIGPVLIVIGMLYLAYRLTDTNSQSETVALAARVNYDRMVAKGIVTSDPLTELERHMRTIKVDPTDPLPDAA